MTLKSRLLNMERRESVSAKHPSEMTLLELYEAAMQEARHHPADATLQRTLDAVAEQLRKSGALI